jgi:hypothetical protein
VAGTWRARRIIKAAVRLTPSVVVVVGGGGACGVAVATWAVSILSSRVTTSEKAGRRAGSWAQHCFTRFRISGDARRSCVRARVGKSQSTRPPQATTSHPTLNAHRAATPMHGSSHRAQLADRTCRSGRSPLETRSSSEPCAVGRHVAAA